MFGYIHVYQPELKVKEYEVYQASYCGLCRSLKKRHGRVGQLTLSYDMTFLALLLTGLYEPKTMTGRSRCLAHPTRRHRYRNNPYFDYAADMNVVLTYYKCLDDWQDEHSITKLLFAGLLKGRVKKLKRLYGKKIQKIERFLKQLSRLEKKGICDLDRTAGYMGKIMGELFVYREDIWEEKLRRMGFFFGKFIYLMDAYEDIEEDLKKGRYNPLVKRYQKKDFEQECGQILKMMMAETSRTFEMLPIIKDAPILRNILYAGVWMRYGQVQSSRKENKKSHDNRPVSGSGCSKRGLRRGN